MGTGGVWTYIYMEFEKKEFISVGIFWALAVAVAVGRVGGVWN